VLRAAGMPTGALLRPPMALRGEVPPVELDEVAVTPIARPPARRELPDPPPPSKHQGTREDEVIQEPERRAATPDRTEPAPRAPMEPTGRVPPPVVHAPSPLSRRAELDVAPSELLEPIAPKRPVSERPMMRAELAPPTAPSTLAEHAEAAVKRHPTSPAPTVGVVPDRVRPLEHPEPAPALPAPQMVWAPRTEGPDLPPKESVEPRVMPVAVSNPDPGRTREPARVPHQEQVEVHIGGVEIQVSQPPPEQPPQPAPVEKLVGFDDYAAIR
jgi:hypothetical protein